MSAYEPLLLALAPYIVPFVIGAVVYLARRLEQRIPAKNLGLIQHLVEAAVLSVEQAHPELAGADKKAAALATIESLLAAAHIKADAAVVDTFLEAACAALNANEPTVASAGLGFGR